MAAIANTLSVTGNLVDAKLEPKDNSKYYITVKNCHARATLRNVWIRLSLTREDGKAFERVILHQHEVGFRDLEPKQSDTRTITIETLVPKEEHLGKYVINVQSDYSFEDRNWECDQVRFVVEPD